MITGYASTVTFTSTDTAATVSATRNGTATALSNFTYPFVSSDKGQHVFWVTFGTTGQESLTVTDNSTTPSITGSADVQVFAPLPLPKHHGWGI
ncbi:MAG TPA: hypothetical protein VKA46_07880 [Gemmataceae bacterium]|nr:hypothetical protein [Gemmataceae bacterium]